MLGWVSTSYQCITSFREGLAASAEQQLVGSSGQRTRVGGHRGTPVAGMKRVGIQPCPVQICMKNIHLGQITIEDALDHLEVCSR